jgi:hypothetical protein
MVSPTDTTAEDRERLEQFLAWRRATQRARWWPGLTALGWRWLTDIAAIGVLCAVFVAFASLLNGDLSQRGSGEVVPSLPAPSVTDPAAGIIEPDSAPSSFPSPLSLPERPARAEMARTHTLGGPLTPALSPALPERSMRSPVPPAR